MQMEGFDPMTCGLLSVFPNHSAVRASNTNIYGPLYFRFSHKRGEGGGLGLCENLKYEGPYMLMLLALTAEWLREHRQ